MVNDPNWKRNWISILGAISGIFLGGVLIIATIGKIADPVLFVEQIREEGLEILFSANTVAVIALAWEILVGVGLLVGIRNYWAIFPTVALSVFFLLLTGRTYYQVLIGERQESYDCGCFGIFLQRTATEAFWQDLFILVPPIVIMLMDRTALKRPLPPLRTAGTILATLALTVYTIGWAGLPQTASYQESPAGNEQESALSPTDQFALFINGREVNGAEIFGSDFVLKFVIQSEELDSRPWLVDIQKSIVIRADEGSILRNADGSVSLDESKPGETLGGFEIGTEGLQFQYQGRLIEMRTR